MGRLDARELLEFPDRCEWGRWLDANHDRSPGVWLALAKKGFAGLGYEEAVEEALRFGWIDSTTRRLDDRRTQQLYTPRKPRSTWAVSNKRRVERLIAEGRMEPAGLAAVEIAKANGSWELLEDVENLVMPPELEQVLSADPKAAETYESLPPSQRKMLLYWLSSAKRPQTRAARAAKAADALADGKSPV